MNKEQTDIYHLIKDIAQYAYQDNLEMKDFLLALFRSEYIERIIEYYEIIYYNPLNVYRVLIKNNSFKANDGKEKYDINVINYICYIYLVFHFRTGESLKLITKELTIDEILDYYEQYHTLADERVIFKAKINYNEKMNYIRKSRASGYKFDLSNSRKNLFIAKHLYLKLFNYPEIRLLRYEYDHGYSYLKSETTTLFVAEYSNIQETISNNEIDHIKFNHSSNILVVFLKDNENVDQMQLEQIFHSQPQIPFDKILMYKDETIVFINRGDGYKLFNIFITPLDINKIEEDYSKNGEI